jgi:chromate transporter
VYFLKLGATGFGGPVALANYMRTDLFERRKWFSDDEYGQGLAIATALPGPMAYKLAIYCGYIAHGVIGGVAVGLAFAVAPFVLVVLAAFVYARFAASDVVRGLFYGVGPVVVALILNASLDLGFKTLKREVPAWIVALVALAATIVLQRELTIVFVLAGVAGIFLFAPPPKPAPAPVRAAAEAADPKVRALGVPLAAALPLAAGSIAWQLFAFFFKTGLLVFGSGLVIVSFVKAYVVDQYHWLDNRTFLDAVAIGMISPGPVVITATFVGYMVGGFVGAVAATVGIFLPSIVLTIAGAPILMRYRNNRRVTGFVRGVTVAVVGVLAGTTYLVGRPVIGDVLTLTLLVVAIAATRLKRIPDQALVAGGAIVGLVAYPLLHPTWLQ